MSPGKTENGVESAATEAGGHRAEEETVPLSDAAKRALAEAEARRRAAAQPLTPVEVGRGAGPEPTRYGDWEKNGLASDF